MCVLIQDVHSGGVAAKDGRLQAGDQLLEVNGFDLTNATHLETRDALMQPYPVYRISLYRERADNQSFQEKEGFPRFFQTTSCVPVILCLFLL